jgi:anti-anti-sigma factor
MKAMPESVVGLGLSISFADSAVVAVTGELDIASTPDFAAVLDALIDRGHRSVTIDCAGLGFIDASGLRILAAARDRLVPTDGEIRIHGASPMAYRLFEITDLLEPLHVERRDPNARHDFGNAAETDPITWQATRLAANSARADALADTLSRMTVLIPEMIDACTGASVTLRRPGHLITAAASDDTAIDLDKIQYTHHQGPCLEAATVGVQTHAAALAHEQRWRAFTPQARGRGIESVLSSPLIANHEPTGALNLYSRTPHSFLSIDQDLASAFATQMAVLLHEPDLATARELDQGIHDALMSRDIIARAQGVLMERLHVDARTAYSALRRQSVDTCTPLRTGAATIVAETQPRSAPPVSDGIADE